MEREKVFCNAHPETRSVMSPAGIHKQRGSQRYICPRCAGVKELLSGTILKVLPGYGFIRVGGELETVFFHFSELKGVAPVPGTEVEFELGFNHRGPVALAVHPCQPNGRDRRIKAGGQEPPYHQPLFGRNRYGRDGHI